MLCGLNREYFSSNSRTQPVAAASNDFAWVSPSGAVNWTSHWAAIA
jgi:hypothetical protein